MIITNKPVFLFNHYYLCCLSLLFLFNYNERTTLPLVVEAADISSENVYVENIALDENFWNDDDRKQEGIETDAIHNSIINDDNTTTLTNCTYLLLAPFSSKDGKKEPYTNYTELTASYIAAAQLAMDDLNTKKECTTAGINFGTLLTRDTQNEDTVGFRELVLLTSKLKEEKNENLNNANDELCGVVGPLDFKGQERSILYTEAIDLPMFFVGGGDIDDLAGKDGKTTIGNFLGITDYFNLFAEYISQQMSITHMAFIGSGSKKIRLAEDVFEDVMKKHNITHRAFRFEDEKHSTREGTIADLKQIKDSGYRNVFLSPDQRKPEALAWMAEYLDELDMLNGDYQYFLFEDAIRPHEIEYLFGKYLIKGSSFAKFIHGTGWFSAIDPYELTGNKDPFVQRWRTFDPARIQYPKQAVPITNEYYKTAKLPVRHSSFVYDSIISLGLGKCAAKKEEKERENGKDATGGGHDNKKDNNGSNEDNKMNNSSNTDFWHKKRAMQKKENGNNSSKDNKEGGKKEKKKEKPIKNDVVRNIMNLKPFESASGLVTYTNKKDKRYRSVDTMKLAMFNFRVIVDYEETNNSPTSNVIKVETPIVAYYDENSGNNGDNNTTNIQKQKWILLKEFMYPGNRRGPPEPQLVIAEENLLSDWVFGLGIFLLSVGCIFAILSFVVVTYCGKDSAIKMAQPLFLKLICLGSLIEVFSIFTFSFDEGRGWDKNSLDIACMASPWLFFVGHATIYSALFCKLWRVDQVMSTRRRAVTPLQVLWPLGIVLVMIVTLLTVWTAISPLTWNREMINEFPPETYGKCDSDNDWFGFFFLPLYIILMICTILTGFIVWKTKDISQDLSDTSTVFYLIVTQMQAWFVGLPILMAIGDTSANSVYLGKILLAWVFAMAPLIIVLLPRISTVIYNRLYPEEAAAKKKKNRGSVHISGISTPSTATAARFVAEEHNSANTFSGRSSYSSQPQQHRGSLLVQKPPPSTEERSIGSSTALNDTSECEVTTGGEDPSSFLRLSSRQKLPKVPENVSFRSQNLDSTV